MTDPRPPDRRRGGILWPLAGRRGATVAGPTAPPASPPGYELLEEVGRGGRGIVYRARDAALGRDVAVKLLSDRYRADSPAALRFLSEARSTGQLQHPGLPAMHQVGRLPDGRPFLAMKLIKGRMFEDILKDRPDPATDRGRFVAVFEAVSLVGTPAFIAPEQAAGEIERVNERSDVFGLGALLAVTLTGKPPYAGKTIEAVTVQAVRGKLDDCFARLDTSGAAPRSRAGGQAGGARTSRRRVDLLESPKPTRTKAVRHQGRSPTSPGSFW